MNNFFLTKSFLRKIPTYLARIITLSVTLLAPNVLIAANEYASLDPLSYGEEAKLPFKSSPPPVASHNGMVSSVHILASRAGQEMLQRGGNAADAATAIGYSLAVVYPCAGSLGGGGFMLIRPPHHPSYFMDFREKASHNASQNMFLDKDGHVLNNQSVLGWRSVAIPGTVAGLEELHEKWGKLPRSIVMAPAIKLAQQGFPLTKNDIEIFSIAAPSFRKDTTARQIFLRKNGNLPKVGELLVQKELAQTLKMISLHGKDAFYKDTIGQTIAYASQTHNGLLDTYDLEHYKTRSFAPLKCHYRDTDIETTPAPSAGGIALCEMLSILDGYPLQQMGLHSAMARHLEVEAMRRAYADRQHIGDPDFVTFQPQKLLNSIYIEHVQKELPKDKAIDSHPLGADDSQSEKMQTTHFSVIDKDGFAISTTQTLNGWFGARTIAGNTGIIMNDEMDDFSIKPGMLNMFGIPGCNANAIAPGKTPISSMAPTIVTKNNKPIIVIGSPGGSRIPTTVLSVILGVIDQKLTIQQAIDQSRIHEQWVPDTLEAEEGALSPSVKHELEQMGYHVYVRSPWGMAEGIVIKYDPSNKPLYLGGSDRRHPGGAALGG